MQLSITNYASSQFSRHFYSAIADGWDIDGAVSEARRLLYTDARAAYEWGTPAIYLRTRDGRLLDSSFKTSNGAQPNRSASFERIVEEQFEAAFSGNYPAYALANGGLLVADLQASRNIGVASATRLDLLRRILEACLLTDPDGSKSALLNQFIVRYPLDPWRKVLRAAVLMAESRYADARTELAVATDGVPGSNVALRQLLAGLCLLREARSSTRPEMRSFSLEEALRYFAVARKGHSASDPDNSNLFQSNTACYEAISSFYLRDWDAAIEKFRESVTVGTGPRKAKGLNGQAYIHILRGELDQAEATLLEALDWDGDFALARSNLGYVSMARGDLEAARKAFSANVQDPNLLRTSPKDVYLAHLALCHVDEFLGAKARDLVARYERVLVEFKIPYHIRASTDELQLAYARRAVARGCYLSMRFNGLEIFALALLTRAYLELQESFAEPEAQPAVADLLNKLTGDIHELRWLSGASGFCHDNKGWFGSIREYYEREPAARAAMLC
jgi:tetratricopeptide (TPR) repeat protein